MRRDFQAEEPLAVRQCPPLVLELRVHLRNALRVSRAKRALRGCSVDSSQVSVDLSQSFALISLSGIVNRSFRVYGAGSGVQGLGLRVWELGFGVWG